MAKAILGEGSETLTNFREQVWRARSEFEEDLNEIIKRFNGYNSVWQDAVYDHMEAALEKHRLAMEKNLETLDNLIAALGRMAEHVYGYQTRGK